LFLLDAIGALVSALLLGVVLVKYQEIFGIPIPTLYVLAIIPCFFALIDLYSYSSLVKDKSKNLKKASAE